MKKIFIYIFLFTCFCGRLLSQTFTANESYIYTRTYMEPVVYNAGNPNSNNTAKQIQSVQYSDALGRPKQDIALGASYNGQDIINAYFYDPLTERQTKQYLPITKTTMQGGLQSVVEAEINSYHHVSNAFVEVKTENSPLMRPLESASPGDAGKMESGKTKKVEYLFNNANEVKRYIIAISGNSLTNTPIVDNTTYHAANTLNKLKSIDEDGNVSYVFKNGLGQTVLTRQENGSEKLDTYYIYDQYGRLVMLVPPKAAATPLTTDSIEDLCYTYLYDDKGRLVEKKLPGKDVEYMVYDKADRLILYQDANMRGNNKWLITKYDKLGRPVYTGFIPGLARTDMQVQCANLLIFEEANNNGFVRNGLTIYYSNYFFTDLTDVLSVNYYDTYPPDGLALRPSTILGQATLDDNSSASKNTKTLPTAYYVKNISDDKWTKTYYYYDERGRSVGAKEINHLEGVTTTYKKLNFAGVTDNLETIHQRAKNGTNITVKERFEYNERYYLKKHYHQVNSLAEELLAEYTYDELGKVTNKKVGNNLQNIDYTYNARGWLTSVNNLNNVSATEKLFAYKLNYTEREGLETPNLDYANYTVVPKYNGNITETAWKSVGVSGTVAYSEPERLGYVYDGANRLLAGFYQYPDNPSVKGNSEIIENYDPNGNILRLKRTGARQKGKVALIDDLSYNLSGNRIISVSDATQNVNGYEGGGRIISYDANGNMTSMPDKGITSISYNYLNLPEVLTHANPLTYYYRADGVKTKKKFVLNNALGATTINTEYLDGFVYTTGQISQAKLALEEQDEMTIAAAHAGDVELFVREQQRVAPIDPNPTEIMLLAYFPTAEGYYDYRNNQYIYQYKDHLGNVRISYTKDPSGSAVVLDQNDYYPFGMNMYGVASAYEATGTPFNYKYNQKELQETGMYDYGWRQYIPDLGRWNGMDKLSESYASFSPYAYVMNNPVMMYDPDGRVSMDWINSFYINSPNGTNTFWSNTGSGFTSQWGHNMDYDASPTNFGMGWSSSGMGGAGSYDGIGSIPIPEVVIKGPPATWGKQIQSHFNAFMDGLNSKTAYNEAFSRYHDAVSKSENAQAIAGVENFLFRDIPMSLAGGELLSIGWRAAGVGSRLSSIFNSSKLFSARGGYGLLGESGLKIGNYRLDLLYSNPAAGEGAGTIFSLKQMKTAGSLFRWDYGMLHTTQEMGLHSTVRFYWNGVKYGSTAQRTWYPSSFNAPFFMPLH